jgi:4-amino-4-deoxy-L-arabinose transferase-like glycosyltransferase
MLLGAAFASPWFLAMEAASPGYNFYYFFERHVMGFATDSQRHGNAVWYYYLPILLGGAMPWTPYAVVGAMDVQQYRKKQDPAGSRAIRLTVCWLVFGCLFLTVAGSKLITYALPLFPAIAILASRTLSHFVQRTTHPAIARALAVWFVLCCGAAILSPLVVLATFAGLLEVRFDLWSVSMLSAAALVAAGALVLFRLQQTGAAVSAGALWTALMFATVAWCPLQQLSPAYSQRSLARQINALDEPPRRIVIVGDRVASVMFYLEPDLRDYYRQGRIEQGRLSELTKSQSTEPATLFAVTEKEIQAAQAAGNDRFGRSNLVTGRFHFVSVPWADPQVASLPAQGAAR